ncbi:MAG: hypothetical protein LKF01_05310 [Lactobacillus sp.]|jgi:gas vesicle protein|nr:hypothetical protein [Lactobacillus sp.]MCH3906031.1 hypothetical protein [Lactobacillus sp.]MCH3990395.1 hypothetical protein [Lactobacillus sp.]MCH4068890.1 hypothetical protein [Lactobacillus sp.]MCI1303292.1 hypothetical protein [Lactobacillus sp.]
MFKHGFAVGALLGLGAAFIKDKDGTPLKDAIYNLLTDEVATGKQLLSQSKQLQAQWHELNSQLPVIQENAAAIKRQVHDWQTSSQASMDKLKTALNKFNQQ